MKILVLGAGAVGGYFGGRLAEAGADVSFFVRERRAQQLAKNGLVVKSGFGDIATPVKTYMDGQLDQAFDMVILTNKSYDLESSLDAIAPAVGPNSAVLPLLNGLAHYEALDARFGAERVIGGLCHLAATLTNDGEIHHLNQLHSMTLGERDGGVSARCQALGDLLAETPVHVRLSPDIAQDGWEKLVLLSTLASSTCLMRASVGDIVATDEGETIVLELLDECIAVAEAAGHRPSPKAIETASSLLTEKGSAFTASMLRDIENGSLIEGEHILGYMVARGHEFGVATPGLRIAYCHLQAYEQRRARF
ncbi:MAG: 2-dehydropantoate 2-reductase [Rhodospirillales bacterium]|nr:2-dehydropantoate 2-reductase [Rhodospirillales bacterium]